MSPYLEKPETQDTPKINEEEKKEDKKEEKKEEKQEGQADEEKKQTNGEKKDAPYHYFYSFIFNDYWRWKRKEQKPLYELFSVMVHSGGASGGHYYAFVKKIDSGEWIKVNGINFQFWLSIIIIINLFLDITVTPATEQEIYQVIIIIQIIID